MGPHREPAGRRQEVRQRPGPGRTRNADGRDRPPPVTPTGLRDMIEQAKLQLTGPGGWVSWLDVAAGCRADGLMLSVENSLLVWARIRDHPDLYRHAVSDLRTYEAWAAAGRQVTRGQRGFPLLAWAPAAPGGPEHATDVTYVFDVAQTESAGRAQLPADPESAALTVADLVTHVTGLLVDEGWRLDTTDHQTQVVIYPASRTVHLPRGITDAHALVVVCGAVSASWRAGGDPVDPRQGPQQGPGQGPHDLVVGQSLAYCVARQYGLRLGPGWESFPSPVGWADGGWPIIREVGETILGAHGWITDYVAAARPPRRPPSLRPAPHLARRSGPDRLDPQQMLLVSVHQAAQRFYSGQLAGSWAEEHLRARFGDGDLARWQPGYAPKRWTALVDHLRGEGFPDTAIAGSGLAVRARTGQLVDRFRDRLVFPIIDRQGRPIAFVGRHQPGRDGSGSPKYLNSPTTALYAKGEHLFGLAHATPAVRAGARPVLVEGPLDAVAVSLAGDPGAAGVATLGTALTADHVAALEQVLIPRTRIVVGLDGDPAGRQGARHAFTVLAARGHDPAVLEFPAGDDPDSYRRRHGATALTARVEQAPPLAERLMEQIVTDLVDDRGSVETRIWAARECARQIICAWPDADLQRTARLCDRLREITDLLPESIQTIITEAQRPARDPPTAPAAGTAHVSAAAVAARSVPTGRPRPAIPSTVAPPTARTTSTQPRPGPTR